MSENSKSTDYDKMLDHLQNKMLDFGLKTVGLFLMLLFKPLAIATEVFFRKDFGERYLTRWTAFFGSVVWVVAAKMLFIYGQENNPILNFVDRVGFHKLAQACHGYNLPLIVGYIMAAVHGLFAGHHLGVIHIRSSAGRPWHSMTRGASIFGKENKVRDFLISIGAVLVLGSFHTLLGFVFFISRFVSYQMDARQQAAFYSRYLDAVDARIETEYLQQALDKGQPPRATDGLFCPLSKRFKGEFRERVARVVAGGPFTANPQGAAAGPTPPQPQTAANQATASPVQAETSNLQSAWRTATSAMEATLTGILQSKRIIRFALLGFVLVACGTIAVVISKSIHFPKNPSTPASLAASTQTAAVKSTPSAQSNAQVQQAAKIKEAEAAAAAFEAEKQRRADEKTKAQAALELQQRQEQERAAALEAQRQNTYVQIETSLAAEVVQLTNFKGQCEARLNENTNKIAGLARSYRKTLGDVNDKERYALPAILLQKEAVLNLMQEEVRTFAANPQLDPNPIGDQVTNNINQIETTCRQMTADLNSLDIDISNAPKKSLFSFFTLKAN